MRIFYSNTFAGRVAVNRDGSIAYSLSGSNKGKQKQGLDIRETLASAVKTSPSGGKKRWPRSTILRVKTQ